MCTHTASSLPPPFVLRLLAARPRASVEVAMAPVAHSKPRVYAVRRRGTLAGYRVYLGETYHLYHRTRALAAAAITKAARDNKGLGSTPQPKDGRPCPCPRPCPRPCRRQRWRPNRRRPRRPRRWRPNRRRWRPNPRWCEPLRNQNEKKRRAAQQDGASKAARQQLLQPINMTM